MCGPPAYQTVTPFEPLERAAEVLHVSPDELGRFAAGRERLELLQHPHLVGTQPEQVPVGDECGELGGCRGQRHRVEGRVDGTEGGAHDGGGRVNGEVHRGLHGPQEHGGVLLELLAGVVGHIAGGSEFTSAVRFGEYPRLECVKGVDRVPCLDERAA